MQVVGEVARIQIVRQSGERLVALVDAEDVELMRLYTWRAIFACKRWRVITQIGPYRGGHPVQTLQMSRVVMRVSDRREVDHINHDTLDNRKCNLRPCTRAENAYNLPPLPGTSAFKGVSRRGSRWRAVIKQGGRFRHLGTFDTEDEAAMAYDAAARRLFGEFAFLNFLGTAGAS